MTRKTPEEIEAMAKVIFPAKDDHDLRHIWSEGYTSNQELSDFKKELVETLREKLAESDRIRGSNPTSWLYEELVSFIDLITQEDQLEGGKEEGNG